MSENNTYLGNIDTELVTKLLEKTSNNVEYFNNITKDVLEAYSRKLDKLMLNIYTEKKKPIEMPLDFLENAYLELTNLLYFMGDKLEQLGINNDMSKAAKQEVYNKAYLENQVKDTDKKNKTTVAENVAVAEQSAQYESVINSIYARAYKMLKYKIDAGYEMVNTLRKIITKRMSEMELSNFNAKNNFIKK